MYTNHRFSETNSLSPGIHLLTLGEIEKKLCFNKHRKALFKKCKKGIKNLMAAGVTDIYIDGSFVSDKESPEDIDGCWAPASFVNFTKIDPAFFNRKKMKTKYGVDFFLANDTEGGSGKTFLEFFQRDRDGNPKGIIKIKLE